MQSKQERSRQILWAATILPMARKLLEATLPATTTPPADTLRYFPTSTVPAIPPPVLKPGSTTPLAATIPGSALERWDPLQPAATTPESEWVPSVGARPPATTPASATSAPRPTTPATRPP